jgi:hypothetical protein
LFSIFALHPLPFHSLHLLSILCFAAARGSRRDTFCAASPIRGTTGWLRFQYEHIPDPGWIRPNRPRIRSPGVSATERREECVETHREEEKSFCGRLSTDPQLRAPCPTTADDTALCSHDPGGVGRTLLNASPGETIHRDDELILRARRWPQSWLLPPSEGSHTNHD